MLPTFCPIAGMHTCKNEVKKGHSLCTVHFRIFSTLVPQHSIIQSFSTDWKSIWQFVPVIKPNPPTQWVSSCRAWATLLIIIQVQKLSWTASEAWKIQSITEEKFSKLINFIQWVGTIVSIILSLPFLGSYLSFFFINILCSYKIYASSHSTKKKKISH